MQRELKRILATVTRPKAHLMYSGAYETWLCLGRGAVAQATTKLEALTKWDQLNAGRHHA